MAEQIEIELIAQGFSAVISSLREVEKSLKAIQDETVKSSKKTEDANKKAEDAWKKQEKALKAQEKSLKEIRKYTLLATSAVAGFGAVATKMALDFNKAFAPIEVLIGKSTEKTKELKKEILGLSSNLGINATELAGTLGDVIGAFGESSDNIKQLEIIAKTAKASGTESAQALELLSLVTKNYGDTSLEAMKKVSDLSTQVMKDGQTTYPDLAGSLSRVVPTASRLGVEMEELMAVFSTSTGVLGSSQEVSAKLQATLVGLTNPSEELALAYQNMGVESVEALIKQKGLAGALKDIKKEADRSGTSVEKYFNNVKAGELAFALTGKEADNFLANLENMQEALGATDEAFDNFTNGTNNLGDNLDRAGVNLQNFSIKIGDELIPRINDALQGVFSFTDSLGKMDQETVSLIVDLGEMLVIVGGVTTAVVTAQKAWVALTIATKSTTVATVAQTVAQKALNKAMTMNPFGAVLIAVTALTVGYQKLTKWTKASLDSYAKQNSELGKIESKSKEIRQENEKMASELSSLISKENDSVEAKEAVGIAIDNLKDKYPALTEEIIRTANAQGNLISILEKMENIRFLEDKIEVVEKLGSEFDLIKSTFDKEGNSLETFLNDLANIDDLDFQNKVVEAFFGKTSITTGVNQKFELIKKELEEKLGKDAPRIFSQIQSEFVKKFNSWDLTWGSGKVSLAKEDILFYLSNQMEDLEKELEQEKKEFEKIVEEPIEITPTVTLNTEAIEKEFQDFKENLEREIEDLDDVIWLLDEKLEELSQVSSREFIPIEMSEDPWHMKKIIDLSGEFATNLENQSKLITDSQNRASEYAITAIKKEATEKEKAIREAQLKELTAIENKEQAIKNAEEKGKVLYSSKEEIRAIETSTKEKVKSLKEGGDKEGKAKKQATSKVWDENNILDLMDEETKAILDKMGSDSLRIRREIAKQSNEIQAQIEEEQKRLAKRSKELKIELASETASAVNAIWGDSFQVAGNNYLKQLDILEMEVNDRLEEYRLEREAEEFRIAEEKREREYEQTLQDLDRTLNNLQYKFEQETSIKKRAELADQIEQANKKKAEEKRRREEELAEKQRQKEERQMLYEFEMEKYEIEVQRIKRQNQMAEAEKAQRIAQVWIDTAKAIAIAWTNSASAGTFWFGPMFTGIMTGVATAQTGIIASQNVKTPIPPAPKPPKFKKGGVIGNHGEEGINAIIGDGVSEVILPLTEDTFNKFGEGVVNSLANALKNKDALFASIEKSLGAFHEQGRKIEIAKLENNFNNQNNINITQTNNIPIEVNSKDEEIGSQMEELAVKVCNEIKNNLTAGSAFDEALMSRSRGVLNALKDQGV